MDGIWFEALPSPRGADEARIERDVARLTPLRHRPVDRVLVPEVKDGDYATMDPAAFARRLHVATGLPATVAVSTVDEPPARLAATLQARTGSGVDGLLLVGGADSRTKYPGPGVTATLRTHGARHHCGVVTIPTRRGAMPEPMRLGAKLEAGARFSVSQILFEADHALALQRALTLERDRIVPTYWSLAPVVRRRDVTFMERLGVHFPPDLKRRLLAADQPERERAALDASIQVATRLAHAHDDEGLGPYGFCVSHVMTGNVEPALGLVDALVDAGLAA